MAEYNTFSITKKSAPTKKMTMEEIEFKLPELCADNPIAKYHIYATINDLNEEEKIEVDNEISSLMFQKNLLHQHYLEKCNIVADFGDDGSGNKIINDVSGNKIIDDVSGNNTTNNIIVCNKYVPIRRKW